MKYLVLNKNTRILIQSKKIFLLQSVLFPTMFFLFKYIDLASYLFYQMKDCQPLSLFNLTHILVSS